MRKIYLALALFAGLISQARADFTGKDASAATITFKNPGACTSVVCVPVFQLYDGTNVVTLTTAGADAVSNTLTGQPVYARNLFFNGTTWDRWQGAVTATLTAETTKVIGTVRIASGGVASGSFASGSIASGALASGSIASGAMVDLGAQADTAAAADNSTASLIALLKRTNQNLTTQTAAINAPIPAGTNVIGHVIADTGSTTAVTALPATPAGTNLIGKVGIDQTTPGTTNGVQDASTSATGAAVPAKAAYNGGNAQSSEPAAATTGNLTGQMYDLTGKAVTSPYANRENMLRCAITLTASTSATTCTGMGAQGASVKIYITDLTCTRNDAGTTAATMTLNDSATTIVDMPNNGGGGGFSKTYNTPLVVAANTAFTVQSGTSLTSVHCSAAGFKGY